MLETLAQGASDILIQPGYPVCAEVNGGLRAVSHRALDDSEVREILVLCANRDTAWTDIVGGTAVNTRYEVFDPKLRDFRGDKVRHKYRVNASPIAYHGQTSCQIVMRAIAKDPPVYTELGLTEDIVRAACPEDGIVYVAGRTGSGKTTTFASILRFILENDTPIKGNLVTHEEPIEFTFESIASKHSIIVQSQIPTHFADFYAANREAMRRKPGLIMIGEMRDEETIRAAVEASQTGHPVFGTVHATNVASVVRRLISRFPEAERATAIYDIIESARFIMAQTLVPGANGRRVAAREWLQCDQRVRDELMVMSDMGRVTGTLRDIMRARGWSFVQEADRLLADGAISAATAAQLRQKAEA
ncbi:ATPase, T2SS/T4P/T4SS family [Bordetella flabilis]